VSKLDEARAWLTALLADGPVDAVEVKRRAAERGIADRTLQRAASDELVRKRQAGPSDPGGQRWVWESATWGREVGDLASEILASLVLENGEPWGACATDVQHTDGAAVLGPSGPRRHWIGRPRGYSKTSDAAAMTIAAVLGGLLPPGERAFFAAADRDQAALTADAIRGFAVRTNLTGAVVVERDKVRFPDQRIDVEIMSSDAPSAWGRRGHWWIIDELTSWADTPNTRAYWEAISTAWPKVPECRVIVISSAGSPAHFSRVEYEAALADPRWRVSDVHEPPPWMRPGDVEAERRRLSAGSFARLFENRWTEAEDHLVTSERLARCVTLADWPLPPSDDATYVIGVDVGVKNDATAIAVGHTETRGERHVILDALDVFRPKRGVQVPLAEVESRVETLAKRYSWAEVLFDPSQALSMMQSLKGRGVRVAEHSFTAKSNDKAATLLHTMLRDGLVDLPDEPDLLDELLHVRVVETAQGLLSVDTTPGRHDDQVDALGIVAVTLMDRAVDVGGWDEVYGIHWCSACERGYTRPPGVDRPCPFCGVRDEPAPEVKAEGSPT
jgi:hypothetical protein